ncbi:MAG: hypothetical protein BAJATHORv1_50208 [Candidatus Thorarchaeota archaeon]|nr:MAG: hypothetical protein BAJATHORv1_50208 [Candidatus Thorarchaeota archaeon]
MDNTRQNLIGVYLGLYRIKVWLNDTESLTRTEAVPVPFLGGQSSGVYVCP